MGRGYDQNLLPENRHPNRFDLDPAGGDHPIALWHTSGHILTANSAALALAGISHNTPDPPGGQLDRDEHGMPTGVLRETAMELLGSAIPNPSQETATEAILRASAALAREGYRERQATRQPGMERAPTSNCKPIARALESRSGLSDASGCSCHRLATLCLLTGTTRAPGNFETGNQPEWLRIGPTKIFSDGALTTRTAAVTTPYSNSTDTGILSWGACRARVSGVQCSRSRLADRATHAIGDRAIRIALDAYKAALERYPEKERSTPYRARNTHS